MAINDYIEEFRRRTPRFSGVNSLHLFFEKKRVTILDISERGMRISYSDTGIFHQDKLAKFNLIITEKGRPVGHELYVRCTWDDHPQYGFRFGSNSIGRNIWRSICAERKSSSINLVNGTEY
jgi:hypothetical protein